MRGTGGNVNTDGNSGLAALTNVSGDATVVAKLVSTQAGNNQGNWAGVILADSANGLSTTPAVALGVNGFTTDSNGNVTDNGTIQLTAELANGYSILGGARWLP